MAESKYGKYIVTDVSKFKKDTPVGDNDDSVTGLFLFLDDEVVKGSFFVRCTWFWKKPEERRLGSHTHPYDEVVAFMGTNPDDVHDLGGEIELWLEDEKHILTKSCLVFIPKGMKHCPLQVRRVDRPIFHFTIGTSGKYGGRDFTK